MLAMRRVNGSDPKIGTLSYSEDGEVYADHVIFTYVLRAIESARPIVKLTATFLTDGCDDERAIFAMENFTKSCPTSAVTDYLSIRGERYCIVEKTVCAEGATRLESIAEQLHQIRDAVCALLLREYAVRSDP